MARPTEFFKALLVGRPKETAGLEHERLSKKIALPVFASDALSSSAYATEEMLHVLILAGAAATIWSIPLAIMITTVLGIVITSYRQTVHAYPNGASAYIVASENLGKYPGLLAASALLIDYVLTVAVSITAGATAITSLWPALAGSRVLIAVVVIALISMLNLRGVKEAGTLFALPTYAYILLIGGLVAHGLIRAAISGADPVIAPPPVEHAGTQALTFLVLARAYSQGSTALTGVEAVSDGVQAFRKPEARNAGHTLIIMGGLLGFLFTGITVLAHVYGVEGPSEDPHRTVLALVALAVWGDGPLFFAVQIATFLILFLAANTAYSDFPRLANFLARDRFMPRQFMNRGDRLAFSNGIVALGGLAAILVVVFNAELTRIINLYVVGVFTSFTLSQTGMVQHWRRLRAEEPKWKRNAWINGIGAFTTFTVLLIVLRTKFLLGAWLVVTMIPVLIFGLTRVHKHYMAVRVQLRDDLRRPQPAIDNHVILLVGRPNKEEVRAFWYAERIKTRDFAAIHFGEKGDPKGLEAQWARLVGLLPTSPFLQTIPKEGSLADSVRRYVDGVRARIPAEDFITVTVTERIKPGPVLLGSRTALLLKTSLLFTPDVVVTNVPFLEGKEHQQDPLGRGMPVRHIVVLLVAAAHNATLRGLEYAKTLNADEVRAVHVVLDPDVSEHHEAEWEALDTGLPLEFIESPYRDLALPLRDYIRPLASDGQTIVTIVLPEFVVRKWWHHALHNQNAFEVKRLFLTEPDVIVTSVPYHLED